MKWSPIYMRRSGPGSYPLPGSGSLIYQFILFILGLYHKKYYSDPVYVEVLTENTMPDEDHGNDPKRIQKSPEAPASGR